MSTKIILMFDMLKSGNREIGDHIHVERRFFDSIT